jgi:DNA-binding IclR family transcriptional regulator
MAKDGAAGARGSGRRAGEARLPGDSGDSRTVRTLAAGMAMLGLFDAEHRQWSLNGMVARLGVSRMTAYRMARTFQGTGHLVHDPVAGSYRLGPAMLAGIYLAEGFAPTVQLARPYLESLMNQTGELAALAVEIDGVAVCADLVASARPFVLEIAVGRVIGDTANAHGKMFAAMKPDAERARIVAKPHRRLTPATITDPASLGAELEKIRSEELAFDFEEHDIGTCAVVAPVLNQTGEVIATLGVVVPTGRFGPEARVACADSVRATAATLSEYFGYARASSGVPADS